MQLSEFQKILKEKVGVQDQRMGVQFLLNALVEEVGELSRALRKGTVDEVGEEICDIIFAVVSIASLVGIDIEPLLKCKYVDRTLSEISREWTDVAWKQPRT